MNSPDTAPAPTNIAHVELVRRLLESRALSPEQLLVATRHSREQQIDLEQAILDLQLLTRAQVDAIEAGGDAPIDVGDAATLAPIGPTGSEDDGQFELDIRAQLREIAASAVPTDLLEQILTRAYNARATDIHLDPRSGSYVVRYRVDGHLHDMVVLDRETAQAVIRGIKIAAGMDIVERRHPQDGTLAFKASGVSRSVRVSTLPLTDGEKIALRLLETQSVALELAKLGLEPEQLELVGQFLAQPYGAILVGGPVGAGKTSTLYSCMDRLNQRSRNLMSIEDPVEVYIPGVNQAQVDTRSGMKFSDGLRAVLRQDPNVLMIGEIRDEETAQIGIRAALTGVLVLSTIHAADAASVIGTLFNYGIPGFTLASALKGVLSQRLLRRICMKCRVPYKPDTNVIRALDLRPEEHEDLLLYRGRGCAECFRTGYYGRTGVYEVMPITELIPDLILRQTTNEVIRQVARDEGMRTLRQGAIAKVIQGLTTVEEMYRVSF